MRNIQHDGVEYTIHYPGHIMFSLLEDIGFEEFVGTLQDLGEATKKNAKFDTLKVIDFCSRVLYWGVRGGDAFHKRETTFTDEDAKDIMLPVLMSGNGDLMTSILEEVMSSWPTAEEEADEPKKAKGSKRK